MDLVLCGMRWSRCLVYLDDVISFGATVSEVLFRLEEVLDRLSDFGLQLKVKKCTFMQTEVGFLGHIVGRTRLACDPGKVRAWHAPGSVKQVRQFVGFNGYYRRFIQNFAGLAEPLVALTQKGVMFAWTEGFSIRSRVLGRSSLLTLARAFVSLSDGIVLLDGIWLPW